MTSTYDLTTCTACDTDPNCPAEFSLTTLQFGGQQIKSGHILDGNQVTQITGTIKNPSSVSGYSVLKCYSGSHSLKATSGNKSNSSIGAGWETITFDLSSDPWDVVVDDYFLVSTDTGSTMKLRYTNQNCMANTNGMEQYDSGTPVALSTYDWIGTATYTGSSPSSGGTLLPPPPAMVRL